MALGRLTPRTAEIVVVRDGWRPFPGPWMLRAVVRSVHPKVPALRAG